MRGGEAMRGQNLPRTDRARSLRKTLSDAEKKLWERLRGRRLSGFKFVRQEPIGPFFADFACRERKLVIEVDGATHSTDAELAKDAARQAFLERAGYRVLRFGNREIYDSLEFVLEAILMALEGREGW